MISTFFSWVNRLIRKPEIEFLLILSMPLTGFFLVNYFNAPEEGRQAVLVGVGALIVMLLFQTFYSIYEHKIAKQKEKAFLSVSAHQMRTPLTAVRWIISEMAQSGDSLESRRDLARVADIATTKLNNIIDAFSAIARIDDGRLVDSLKTVDMCELIEKAVEDAEPVSRQYGVKVSFDGPCDDLFVSVDPFKIEIVFSNLINNGIKYNQKGGVVSLSARRVKGGKAIEVSVHDTGIGIPPEEQTHIFERFYRGEKAQQVNQTGSGLGLYLTKLIVEQHKGKIWLDSAKGQGTTFHFVLPSSR
jgi:signal transduction histidine kinase